MKNSNLKTTILLLALCIGGKLSSQAIFIGPMLHYNFGGENRSFSYGIEVSFWGNIYIDTPIEKYGPPLGFDIGIEFEKNKRRIYTELQTGSLIGISSGAVLQWSKENPIKIGYQGSAWFAFFGGIDARVRIFKDEKVFAPGIFVKVPVYFYDDIKYSNIL